MKFFSRKHFLEAGISMMELVVTMGIMTGVVYGTIVSTGLMKDEEKRSETFMSQQMSKNTISKLVDQASLGINNIKFHPAQSIKTGYDEDNNAVFETISGWYYDPELQQTDWRPMPDPIPSDPAEFQKYDDLVWMSTDGNGYVFRQNAFTLEKKNIGQNGGASYSKYYFSRCVDIQGLKDNSATTKDLVVESLVDPNDAFYDLVNFYPVYEKFSQEENGVQKVFYRVKCCAGPSGSDAFDPNTCTGYLDNSANDKYRVRIFVAYRKDDTSPDILKMYPNEGELKHVSGAGFAVYFNHETQPDIAYVHSYLLINKCQLDKKQLDVSIPVDQRNCQWGTRFYANFLQRTIERSGIGNTGVMVIK